MEEMNYQYTRHQVPRGSRADAEDNKKIHLMKNVSILLPTYQIRLLTFRAMKEKKKLVIHVPKTCKFHKLFENFRKEHQSLVTIERLDS